MATGGRQVALVTGAASGIGKAAAQAFAGAGFVVVAADIAEIVEGDLRIRCDVTDEASVQQLIAQTISAFGRLDVAFNNAGTLGELGATADCDAGNFDRVIATNLRGVFLCMREELRHMASAPEGGAIVNCSSVAGLVGLAGAGPYAASKHGVIGLTRTAALEYAQRGIRVNAICPGPVETPMLDQLMAGMPGGRTALIAAEPAGRLGAPREIAEAVLWLCSPAASFVTGQAIAVDGGWTVC